MKLITETFNNREIAIAIWITLFFTLAMLKKDVRTSLFNVVKAFFGKKIFSIYLLMTIYVFIIIFVLHFLGLWSLSFIKQTLFWYLGVAFISIYNVNKVNEDENHLKKLIIDNLKFIAILEFIISLYSFNLFIELIFVPFIILIVMLSSVSETKKEYLQVKKILNFILSMIGFIVILFTIYKISTDFGSFANESNLTNFFLPPILTFFYLPFIYFLALFISYEFFFVRLKHFIKEKRSFKLAKRKILTSFHFKLKKLNKFAADYIRLNVESNNDITIAIKIFNESEHIK